MARIPRDTGLDSTLALLSEGYTFIGARCQRYQSDLFETRLMLRNAICITGEDAAKAFYTPGRFTRVGAAPPTALKLLQDKGSVQQLDGESHRWRKQMFMALMTPDALSRLLDSMNAQWRAQITKWSMIDQVVLHDEVQEILCRAVCEWAGVPLPGPEAKQRADEFGAMIDGAGAVGPRNWRGLWRRARAERWLQGVVERVRAGAIEVTPESAVHVIAWHRGLDGALLDTKVAAVELLNVLRPTVAVAWFITFAALALHQYPACRQQIQTGADGLDLFVQEVRRFYPFFPFVGGRVQDEFEWQGHQFANGTWVLLDLYGTNHDPRLWEQPEEFRPERFRDWNGSAYNLIPQGAGDFEADHRCAGEWITIALMKTAVGLLTSAMQYDVPDQDLRVSLSRIPTLPKSGFVISNVRPI